MRNPEDSGEALREGLRAQESPSPSKEFDDRVLAALSKPAPWWEAWLRAAQPALSAMCCSIVVTLAVIYLTLQGPDTISMPKMPAMPHTRIDMAVVDMILDEPHLRADSLEQLPRLSAVPNAMPFEPSHRPPNIRHACLPIRTLVA